MAVVPLNQVWVDANFKELQIANIRVGQPATLTADLYGGSVEYHGTVVGFSAGTGASFALLPAQNATGNWIKVVQRLPVRIVLDPQDLAAHPLQVGLSMRVEVSTTDRNGARLPQTAANAPAYATGVFDDADRQADARVEAIIAANLAGPAHGSVAHRLTQVPPAPRHMSPPAPIPPLEGTARILGTLALSLAIFMNVLDTSIANVSIPAISGDLGCLAGSGHLGDHLLRRGQCDIRAVDRLADAALWPGATVHAVHIPVRDRLLPVWPGTLHRDADFLSRHPGRSRRAR